MVKQDSHAFTKSITDSTPVYVAPLEAALREFLSYLFNVYEVKYLGSPLVAGTRYTLQTTKSLLPIDPLVLC